MQVATDKEHKGSRESSLRKCIHVKLFKSAVGTNVGLLLVITTLIIGEPCIPADRWLVIIHITVYGIVHDTYSIITP